MQISDMKIHHFGVATSSLDAAAEAYEAQGFLRGKTTEDRRQNVKICFMEKPDELPVELIEPLGDDSPVSEMLRRSENGVEPYHVCYAVKSLDSAIADLRAEHWVLVRDPMPATAFGDARIAFLYSKEAGLIELLEKA